MTSDSQDGLFAEALVERVEQPAEVPADLNGGINKRFRPFEPDAVMLVPPSLDEWLPQGHLARFIAELVDTERAGPGPVLRLVCQGQGPAAV